MPAPFAFALCADDYAMTPGVSRGIREALDAGVISATSAMTNAPDWPREAAALAPYRGRADLGLHLDLTLLPPLGPMPRHAPAGRPPPIGAVVQAARRGTLALDEIAAEITRQLDAFEAATGHAPNHVDGHQHVHVLAPIRRLVLAELARRGWTPWLRDSADRPLRILCRRSTLPKAIGVAVLASGLAQEAREAGLTLNDGFAGFSRFDAAQPYEREFSRALVAPGRRHLVMAHPGIVDDALRRLDPVVESRARELAFLLSPALPRLLRERGATLARLSTMVPSMPAEVAPR